MLFRLTLFSRIFIHVTVQSVLIDHPLHRLSIQQIGPGLCPRRVCSPIGGSS